MASWVDAWMQRHGYPPQHHNAGAPALPDYSNVLPPYGTYPPEYGAQIRAIGRGEQDTLTDTRTNIERARQDSAQQLHDLTQSKHRGIGDIRRERRRGEQDIARKRTDVQTDTARGREDFSTRLGNLITNFQQQAGQQTQAANARGVLDSSTQAASAAARGGNFARARQPLDTGLARLNEDSATSLARLGTAEQQLQADTGRAAHQLRQDVHHDTRLSNRDLHRTIHDTRVQRQRARREAALGTADIAEQASYAAHQLHPNSVPKPTDPNRRRKNR